MSHDHHHHHHHPSPASDGRLTKAFVWGIGLNLIFVLVETTTGLMTGSLALLTDAGHNLSDVGSLALALLAFRLARIRPKGPYSYGYRKFTVWASLINSLVLLAAVGIIGYEALQRLSAPPAIPGYTVALVAGVGIVVNAFSAWLFHRDQSDDLNVRGAYLHLAADAAVSAGVVVAGLLMQFTGWGWLDPLISFLILGVILWSTWGLLRDSFRLALDAVPPQIDTDAVRAAALATQGVAGIHHIHVWAMSTMENALTAHLVLEEGITPEGAARAKHQFRHALEHLNIAHATLETEFGTEACVARECAGSGAEL
ncbi:MAG: cation transporter [Saprospiraceae bacterium]|nr:cation transporter [Saprospiraceae bacterium]